MSIKSRVKDVQHWLQRARKRLWGTAQSIEEVEKELKDPKLSDAAKNRLKHKHKDLIDEYRRRKEVKEKLAKKLEFLKDKADDVPSSTGTGNVGYSVPSRPWNPYGRNIPNWMIVHLDKTYAAGCHFTVISGVRTAAYSISLCYGICGAPSCSGTCAGASSNHNFEANGVYPNGAVDIDVAHASSFESTQFQVGSPLRNYLVADTNHFSVSGR
jgi:hypothetical protein